MVTDALTSELDRFRREVGKLDRMKGNQLRFTSGHVTTSNVRQIKAWFIIRHMYNLF